MKVTPDHDHPLAGVQETRRILKTTFHLPHKMENGSVLRQRMMTVMEEMQDSVATCCFDMFENRNKIVPSVILQNSGDFDFVEINPQRRIRVIHLKPYQSFGENIVKEGEDNEEVNDTEDEEYWFENAAPKRLPVIQPKPQPQQNRIINKFEPREPSNVGQGSSNKSFHDHFISPGRLPRKNLVTKLMDTETDDFEDDQDEVISTGSQEEGGKREAKNLTALEHMSEIMLEITGDPDSDSGTLPKPKFKKHPSVRPTSPSSGSSSRSASPDHPGAADDSLHPSPELPHRAVCARPDAVDSGEAGDAENTTSLVITGGNLGGVANKGFSEDEDIEVTDSTTEVDESQTDQSPEDSSTDCGYSRARDLASIAASDESEEENSNPVIKEAAVNTSNSNNEEQPPIMFFLHGIGGSADSWNSQLAFFVSQGYEVVAPDLLGHGFSSCPDNPKSYTFSKLLKDILTIFDTYIPESRKTIIFGHSYGCSFTTALTRARLDRVVSLVLIASGGPTPLAPPPHVSKYPKCVKILLKRMVECKAKNSQNNRYSPRGKTIKFRESFDIPRYVIKHMAGGALWPEGDAALHRRISVPTLLVYGMRDNLVSLVEECEMERTLPR